MAAAGHRPLPRTGRRVGLAARAGHSGSREVLDIFRRKTLAGVRGGAALGRRIRGAEDDVALGPETYSDALGIAYQIRDDLEDLDPSADLQRPRPSLPLAVAFERARGDRKALLERLACWLAAVFG